MTREKLLEFMKDGRWNGDYHESDDIMSACREVVESYGDPTDEIDDISDLEDNIFEVADSNTPIYNRDLAEWFGGNWSAVDDYHDEVGKEGDNGIMQTIMAAYCYTLEQVMREALEYFIEQYKEENDENK